jgi:general secretion pathway protein K
MRQPSTRTSVRAQSGAAVITAMLVVALATTVVATLFLRESIAARSVENRLALSQTRWIERAAADWAKVILRADAAAGSVDHLGEPWAVPVAETRLDETVTAGARIGDRQRPAMLSGQLIDAQSRINLGAIVQSGQISAPHLQAARRLFTLLDLPESLADAVVQRLLQAQPRTQDGRLLPAELAAPIRLADLASIAGFDAATLARIEPFMAVIPTAGGANPATRVNLNTAPAEVLAAVVPELDLAAARRFVERRRDTFFRDLDDAAQRIDGRPVLAPALLGVGSAYFLLRGVIRFDRVEVASETLLSRASGRIEIVWQQRL